MHTLKTLIDDAAQMCGSDYALAKRCGIDRGALSKIRAGTQPLTPENVALIANVLELPGAEVQRLAALSVINNPKNQARREELRRAFFAQTAITGSLLSGVLIVLATISPSEAMGMPIFDDAQNFTIYTSSGICLLHWMRVFWLQTCRMACRGDAFGPGSRPVALNPCGFQPFG